MRRLTNRERLALSISLYVLGWVAAIAAVVIAVGP